MSRALAGRASARQLAAAATVGRASARLLLLLSCGTALAAPLPARDLNPLLAGFGLPAPMPARPQVRTWSIAADLNWASTALEQQSGRERLLVDAETREVRLTIGRSSSRFALQLQIPWRYTGGGVLDGAIDGWHDFFGLPEGKRSQLTADRIRIAYERNGALLYDIHSSASGLADSSLDLGYALLASPDAAATAWLSIELPTGDEDRLTGSGATDLSVVLAGEHQLGERWSIFGQAAATWLGESERLAPWQRTFVWSGLAGLSWRAWRELQLGAQLSAHSGVLAATDLDFLAGAVVLTVGGNYRFQSGWVLDLAVSEDLMVETAPDVGLVLGLRREW